MKKLPTSLIKIFTLIVVIISLSNFKTSAAYLENLPTVVINPDGTEIHCFSSGDEFFNYLHDADGFTIIQDKDGYYYYAVLNNGELVPSQYRVNEVNPVTVGLHPYALITPEEYQKRVNEFWKDIEDPKGKAPHQGTINNIVVYIRFSDDTEFNVSRNDYDALFNPEEGISMKNYFNEVSYGQLNIESHHYPEIDDPSFNLSFQDEYPRAYYQPYNETTNPIGYQGGNNGYERRVREHTLLVNAINSISSQIPTDLIIDGDNDNYVDNICFIIRGSSGGWADLLWAHRWALYTYFVYINGKRVYDYTFQPENQTGVSTLAHEMFHTLGAPDLYRYSGSYNPVGPWDLMAGGFVHMGAHMKRKYTNSKWINQIPTISQPGVYTLNPITSSENNAYRINSPNSSSEYFIVEYRKREGLYENNLPNSGLLVYRINLTAGNGNAGGPPDEVYIYRPFGTTSENGNINSAAFSSNAGRTSINDSTNPSSFLSNGNPGGLDVRRISSIGETISFQLGEIYYVTVTADPPYGGTVIDETNGEYYQPGEEISISANPFKGYILEKWTIDGDSISNENPLQYTVPNQDVEIVGHFKWVGTYNISLTAYPDYAGNVIDDTNDGPYMPNSVVSISAIANQGYEFKKWTIDGDSISIDNPLLFTIQTSDVEIVGHFGWITDVPLTALYKVEVYPNPFSSTLNIRNADEINTVSIINIIGHEILNFTTSNSSSIEINTEHLKPGIYLISLKTKSGETVARRLVKK